MSVRQAWLVLLAALAAAAEPAPPALEFAGIIGDIRDHAREIVDVATDNTGQVLVLMQGGRIAVFQPDGRYERSLRGPRAAQRGWYLATQGRRVMVGDSRRDFPWVFADRRQGSGPGRFLNPVAIVADARRIYVAEAGNRRVQVFARGHTDIPVAAFPLEHKPRALAVRGDRLYVADERGNLLVYTVADDGIRPDTVGKILWGALAMAVADDGSLYVACAHGHAHFVRRYVCADGQWTDSGVVAPAVDDLWPELYVQGVPLVTGPDGQVWFSCSGYGGVLSLDPATDRITARLKGLHRPLAVGFDAAGNTYVGCGPKPGAGGPEVRRFAPDGADLGTFGAVPFCPGDANIWGLLPAPDGGVYARVIEEGRGKGWPAFTLKKVRDDGTADTILDLGNLFAKRTRFPPWAAMGNMAFDHAGNVVIAIAPYVAVMKLAPDGEVVWEAGRHPRNADEVPFVDPVDVAVDSADNIWVADAGRDVIVCLASDGRHLLTYGGHAAVDTVDGRGFDGPAGVAVATVGAVEYLVVGDGGNQRLVKFRLVPTR